MSGSGAGGVKKVLSYETTITLFSYTNRHTTSRALLLLLRVPYPFILIVFL